MPANHTAGEWRMGHPLQSTGAIPIQYGNPSDVLAWVCGEDTGLSRETALANARLIVGAPKLLAACKSVLESLTRNLDQEYLPETRAALREAIAAADCV